MVYLKNYCQKNTFKIKILVLCNFYPISI